jgi:hypothetical protein
VVFVVCDETGECDSSFYSSSRTIAWNSMNDLSDFAHYYAAESNEKLHQSNSSTSIASLRSETLKRNSSVKEFIQIVANWNIREEDEVDLQWIPFERPNPGRLTIRNQVQKPLLEVNTNCSFYIANCDSPELTSIDDSAETLFDVESYLLSPEKFNVTFEGSLTTPKNDTPTSLLESAGQFSRSDSKLGTKSKMRSKSVDYSHGPAVSPKLGYLSLFRKDERFDPCHLACKNFQRNYRDTRLSRVQTFIRTRSSVDFNHQRRRSDLKDIDSWQLPLEKPSRLERVKSTLSLTSNLSLSKITIFGRGSKLHSALL